MNDESRLAPLNEKVSLQVQRAVDKLCDEFEQRLQSGDSPVIEDYLARLPEDAQSHGLRQLVAIQLEVNWKLGKSLNADELRRRFPAYLNLLERELESVQRAAAPRSSLTERTSLLDTIDFERPEDRTSRPDDDQPLAQLGRYRIVRVLGEGGFGRVYLAEDAQLGRPVALKVPKKAFFASGQSIDLFLSEARTAAQLKHPGLVSVYDVQLENGSPYIVQEYIEGSNMQQWLRHEGATYERIVELMLEIVDAVGFLHQNRLVHRDLKPGNILIDRQGHAHVADFGLAVHESAQWSRAGEVAGTWGYISPEQLRGETHLLDGRSDLWSLGVILYEALVQDRPFPAVNPQELRDQILALEPRPLRQRAPRVPQELERICLKCLQSRRSDRYSSAVDLAEDLRQFLTASSKAHSESKPVITALGEVPAAATCRGNDRQLVGAKVVPKGLRSFDENDSEFFLELLPGPFDRDGLPETIRFWKTRIESCEAERTFSVGLVYGPSGCGKSSIVRAGLLPRLAKHVTPIYIEATSEDTETRLLRALQKRLAPIDRVETLVDTMKRLRETGSRSGCKVLVVLDQFEQWLHTHSRLAESQLVGALRHCDGCRVQCLVLVRDDFWMPATQFMRAVESRLVEGHNSSPVDLFSLRHAETVLTKFGCAFGILSNDPTERTADQTEFVRRSVSDLAHDGKVICVRLSLFAEMMKWKPWTVASLQTVGGTQGVGVAFLDEMFSAPTAPPQHRLHQVAARSVLQALLPDVGSNIKGNLRSAKELLKESGYTQRPGDFSELTQILDGELRLITPTDPEGLDFEPSDQEASQRQTDVTVTSRSPVTCYYQLTHDYLVPSLRDWLSRKQRETYRGRAELRLGELAALWRVKPETRNLPSWWEYLTISWLVPLQRRTNVHQRMMKSARRYYGVLAGSGAVILFLAAMAWQSFVQGQQRDEVRAKVESLQSTMGPGVPLAIANLRSLPRRFVRDELERRFEALDSHSEQLPLAYALAQYGELNIRFLVDSVSVVRSEECSNLAEALSVQRDNSLKELQSAAKQAALKSNFQLKARIATVALHMGDTSLARQMLQTQPPAERQDLANSHDWKDQPSNATWAEVSLELKKRIHEAQGFVTERFAFCQSMPWEAFLETIESLRPSCYRPTKIRPFERDGRHLISAIWIRDARRWELNHDLSVEQLPLASKAVEKNGMLPEDIAAYASPKRSTLYLVLWCERSAESEQRRIAVDLTETGLQRITANMGAASFRSLKCLQSILATDSTPRYSGIWSNFGPPTYNDTGLADLKSESNSQNALVDFAQVPLGTPSNSLDRLREQLANEQNLSPDEQKATSIRISRARALYYLDDPEKSLASLDKIPVSLSNSGAIWQLRALNLARLGKRTESALALRQHVTAINQAEYASGYETYTKILISGWLGQIDEAEQQLSDLSNGAPSRARRHYNAACAAAQLSRILAGKDPAREQRFKQRAIQFLRLARQLGFRNLGDILSDPDLSPLTNEEGFVALLKELGRDGLHAVVRLKSSPFEFKLNFDRPADEQVKLAPTLEAQGYRPYSLAPILSLAPELGTADAPFRTSIGWFRPELKWDPIERAIFIESFSNWSGDVRKLKDILPDAEDAAVLSGIALALGSQLDTPQMAKEQWRPVLERWHVTQSDNCAHSASGWALQKWGFAPPPIRPDEESAERNWNVTKPGLTMLRIPAGRFNGVGPTSSQQTISVGEFWISDREITRGLFEKFVADSHYQGDRPENWPGAAKRFSPTEHHPVQMVSWYDAAMFCNWLSLNEGLSPAYEKSGAKERRKNMLLREQDFDVWRLVESASGFRLPSATEWEYACRAGTTTDYSFGDDPAKFRQYLLCHSSTTNVVGTLLCNGWGLFDNHGNVQEWCGSAEGEDVAARGGGWSNGPEVCRSWEKTASPPESRASNIGFRVALPGKR